MAMLQWMAAVVVALFVLISFASCAAAKELLDSRRSVNILAPHKRLLHLEQEQRFVSPRSTVQLGRSLLQRTGVRFCTINGGECIAQTLQNTPDKDTKRIFNRNFLCGLQFAEMSCHNTTDCVWATDRCVLDFNTAVRSCYDIDYLTVRRTCSSLTAEPICNIIPGCKWQERTRECSPDQDEIVVALNNNQQLGEAYLQNVECREAVTCGGVCSELNGTCFFPGLVKHSNFSISSAPMCQFFSLLFDCPVNTPASCLEPCKLDEQGTCFFPIASEAFVDITYVEDPTLQEQMKAAVHQCPGITSGPDCANFSP